MDEHTNTFAPRSRAKTRRFQVASIRVAENFIITSDSVPTAMQEYGPISLLSRAAYYTVTVPVTGGEEYPRCLVTVTEVFKFNLPQTHDAVPHIYPASPGRLGPPKSFFSVTGP